MKPQNYYLCPLCFGIVKRESKAKSIKSFCTESKEDVKMKKVESADKLAETLRKEFLKNQFDLSTFKPKERLFLESAFEQGAKVVFNGMNR